MNLEVIKIEAGEQADLVFVGLDALTSQHRNALSRALSAFSGNFAQIADNRISTKKSHAAALARNLRVLVQPSGLRLNMVAPD
jgi:hypothetical protein